MELSVPASGVQTPHSDAPRWGLERRAAALERFAARHQAWILALWTLLYFGGTMLRARGKPFWYDEILTLLEARQSSLPAAMRALGDIDWMPPANHLTFYAAHKLLGGGEIAFRIPTMLAFWVFCISLFVFARRRVSILFALMAMLLPYASAFQMYSYEARSYAFVLAFCGIALVSWQAAAGEQRRAWPLLGLAAGIAGALCYQYWAVLLYVPLGGAEIYRSIVRRRIDWPMWLAFAAGCAPLLLFRSVILHGLHNWSPSVNLAAHPSDYWDFYRIGFRVYFAFAIPAVLLLAAWLALGGRKEEPAGEGKATIPGHEWVAAALLLLLPVAAVSIALVVPPHAYTLRYAAPAVAGYALLGSFLAARLAGKRSAIALACVLAALAPFTYLMTQPDRFENPFRKAPGLEAALQHGPVVVADLVHYVQLWYYAPADLKPRLICLQEIPDKEGLKGPFTTEFPKVGVPVMAYSRYAVPGNEFLIYAKPNSLLPRKIEADGGRVEVVQAGPGADLLRARMK